MSDHQPQLPPAVARLAEEADALHKSAYGTVVEDAPPVGQEQLPEGQQSEGQPAPADNWEHKYNSLKGRYDAELPRLREQITTLLGETTALRGLIAAMEDRPAPQAAPQQPAQHLPADQRLTEEEISSYGEDMINVIKKASREMAFDMTNGLRAEVDSLKAQLSSVGSVTSRMTRERMTAEMDAKIPDWHTQNNDPEFNAWLDRPDPYSGYVRRNMLTHAWENNHSDRVIAFFKGYRDEQAVTTAPQRQMSPPADQPTRLDLTQFVAPGRPTGGAPNPGTPAGKPIFTKAEVSRFFKDRSLNKWAGREAEADALERAIHEAGQDGRIR